MVKKMSQNVDNIIMSREKFLNTLLNPQNNLYIEILNLSRVPPVWQLKQRILPFHYLSLVIDSINHVEIDSFIRDIGTNGFLWVNPGVAHSMRPRMKSSPHQFYHLQFALINNNSSVILEEPVLFFPNAKDLKEAFSALRDAFQQHGAYSESLIRARLATLICEVFRLSDSPQENKRILTRHQRKIINNLLQTTALGKLSTQILAQKNQLTPDYFSRIFKNTYGCSPRSWLTQERMRRAALLLAESNLSITEIATTVGYDDIYVFSKLFKKYNAKSPRHYRNSFLA